MIMKSITVIVACCGLGIAKGYTLSPLFHTIERQHVPGSRCSRNWNHRGLSDKQDDTREKMRVRSNQRLYTMSQWAKLKTDDDSDRLGDQTVVQWESEEALDDSTISEIEAGQPSQWLVLKDVSRFGTL